jgi:hypothetical protein
MNFTFEKSSNLYALFEIAKRSYLFYVEKFNLFHYSSLISVPCIDLPFYRA